MFATATLPAVPASASAARRFVRETLGEWRLQHLDAVAGLLVSELVTNAILHADSDSVVRLRYDGKLLRVEVSDASELRVRPRAYSQDAGTGRGLMLVQAMSAAWGSEPTAAGKQVWFELATQSGPQGTG